MVAHKLTRPWSDSFAVSHLVTTVQTLLHRSRCMLGVVIASILAVASVTATEAVAGLALHQGIQTLILFETGIKTLAMTICYDNNREIWMHNLLPMCSIFNRFLAWRSIGCFIYMKCVER